MILSIFGYGAPKSDVEAIKLMKEGWGDVKDRSMEETEIVDIRPEDDLRQNWDAFIHTHHLSLKYTDSFLIARGLQNIQGDRVKLLGNNFMKRNSLKENPIPKALAFADLYDWVSALTAVEH